MYRLERKYFLDVKAFYKLKSILLEIGQLDPNSNERGYYPVSSIYYDDKYYRCYLDKVNGEINRFKFRLRTYSETFTTGNQYFLEQKIKKNKAQYKLHFKVDERFLNRSMNYNPIEFSSFSYPGQLYPVIKVLFKRKAYLVNDLKDEVRLTFDYDLYFESLNNLKRGRFDFGNRVLLEIKTNTEQYPMWLSDFLKNNNLRDTEFSKYAECMKRSFP